MIDEVLAARLAGFSGLTDLVADRIYAMVLPQAPVYPAVTYQLISSVRDSAMGTDTGNVTTNFQISIWNDSGFAAAKAVKEQVRACLQRWGDGDTVITTFIENEVDLYQPEVRIWHIVVDIRIHHTET